MPVIKVLSEDIINKIAAGEVIERPASVVKELVENSLDAAATSIRVEIRDYGKELIAVHDNGGGMDQQDAKNCLVRHATSKITSASDLFSIQTLGFRGEALASISAVSRLALTTKPAEAVEAFRLLAENDHIASTIAARETGTTIEVRDLFYNTPARKKFLKSNAVELRHMLEAVASYALANPKTNFCLTHNQQELLRTAATEDRRNTIAALYGTATAKGLLPVKYKDEAVEISGFISTPAQVRHDTQQQVLIVNGRWVRSEEITAALYEGYHTLLFMNRHPIFVLQLSLDPQRIDVNVHPAKTRIKIEQKELVCKAVSAAVKETLQKHHLISSTEMEFTPLQFARPATKAKYMFEPAAQTVLRVGESAASYAPKNDISEANKNEIQLAATVKFPAFKLLGQVHKTFFVAETAGGVFFIDQHAAHERVLYEEFMEQFLNFKVGIQQLVQGEIIELTAEQKITFQEHLEELQQFGFTIEPFGEKAFVLKAVPMIFGRIPSRELFLEVLALLPKGKNLLEQQKEAIITRMACRAAVMAGEVLTTRQMERILRDLALKKNPYTCPHGRPVMIKTEVEELEKKFKRR